jgi:hypothetical protein
MASRGSSGTRGTWATDTDTEKADGAHILSRAVAPGPRRVTCQHAGYTLGFRPLLPGRCSRALNLI